MASREAGQSFQGAASRISTSSEEKRRRLSAGVIDLRMGGNIADLEKVTALVS